MKIEDRITELEARIDEQECKRRALRNELVALQFVLGKLLPFIAASSIAGFDDPIAKAKTAAQDALSLAGFDTEEISDVLAAIDALRDDLLNADRSSDLISIELGVSH